MPHFKGHFKGKPTAQQIKARGFGSAAVDELKKAEADVASGRDPTRSSSSRPPTSTPARREASERFGRGEISFKEAARAGGATGLDQKPLGAAQPEAAQPEEDRNLLQRIKNLFVVPEAERLDFSNLSEEDVAGIKRRAITGAVATAGVAVPLAFGLRSLGFTVAKTAAKAGSPTSTKAILQAAGGKLPKGVTLKAVRGQISRVQAGEIAVNTVNAAKTTSWLTKLVSSARANPATTILAGGATIFAIVKGINELIGTYNFAGFIGEEASQTVGLTSGTAIKAVEDDLRFGDGEALTEENLGFIREQLNLEFSILDPVIWTGIIDATPQKRVADKLKIFDQAALLSAEAKERRFEELVKQFEEQSFKQTN